MADCCSYVGVRLTILELWDNDYAFIYFDNSTVMLRAHQKRSEYSHRIFASHFRSRYLRVGMGEFSDFINTFLFNVLPQFYFLEIEELRIRHFDNMLKITEKRKERSNHILACVINCSCVRHLYH